MCNQYTNYKKNVAIEAGAVIGDDQKFANIWDTQTVSGDTLDFFPAQPQAGVGANYQSNALPGTHSHLFVGALLSSTSRQIKAESEEDAHAIVDALSHGTMTIKADSDNKQLSQVRLAQVFNVDELEIKHSVEADGTTDRFDVHLPPGSVQPLPNPVRIAQGQVFNVRLEFGDASGVPTDTLELNLELARAIPRDA